MLNNIYNSARKFLNIESNRRLLFGSLLLVSMFFVVLYVLECSLLENYSKLQSILIKDRNGLTISVLQNGKGEFSNYVNVLPERFKSLLIKKEDRFFFFHPGINPISIIRAVGNFVIWKEPGGSSTITQQLAKNLLGNESNRTFGNKITELFYTLSLEVFLTKEDILTMYANTVYMGNNIQGFGQASIDYFGKNLNDLNESEFVSLLATLSSPGVQNPWKSANKQRAKELALKLGVAFDAHYEINKTPDAYLHSSMTAFEFNSLKQMCNTSCTTTIDKELTERLRAILKKNISLAWDSGARNGAIVVIKLPENELLAIVGTPDANSGANGHSINMAIEPRPIGSTAKPFIYLEAFEKGLRPYTTVEDREYKYPISTGYPLYPKNYDGLYHGTVTLHQSLSNSYNVPTVKTLEYIGLSEFYDFLEHKLSFVPLQELDSYGLGIALGGLEMDPLTLAHYFTLFPSQGVLKPLRLFLDGGVSGQTIKTPMSRLTEERKIADSRYVELVTKILNDRKTGVEQFGLESSLNLAQDNYAVKTGTSRDYHDSWTVGYTPDYVVAVWLGNAENEPLKHVTGQSGAGYIWNESMDLLTNSKYNFKTPFVFESIRAFSFGNSLDFGLKDDVISEHLNLMNDNHLILSPHDGDTILLEDLISIPLKSSNDASWYINNVLVGKGVTWNFSPSLPGLYTIEAKSGKNFESISITIKRN